MTLWSEEPFQRLKPGETLPAWVSRLDRTAFGEAWKAPADHESVWLLPEVAFARWACIPAAGEAELLRITVDPAHRGSGLGRTLLEACQADLVREGMTSLFLEVRASNAPAISLYRACGWKPCGRRPCYYADGEDALLYQHHVS